MFSDDEQGKHLDDQHTPPYAGRSTKPYDQEHWHRQNEQTALLCERLLLAWQTTLELIDRRWQITQDRTILRLQRQRLLEQQAAYLDSISPF